MAKVADNVTVIVEKDDAYQATYLYKFSKKRSAPEIINHRCGYPNLAYRFECRFNHFLFYKDNFSYDDAGGQHVNSELMGIKDEDIGKTSAREMFRITFKR